MYLLYGRACRTMSARNAENKERNAAANYQQYCHSSVCHGAAMRHRLSYGRVSSDITSYKRVMEGE